VKSDGYSFTQAAADLEAAGQLRGILVPGEDGLLASAIHPGPGGFRGAKLDSRKLEPGQLFIAMQGEKIHGRIFANDVLAQNHWVLTDEDDEQGHTLAGRPAPPTSGVLLTADPAAALRTLAGCWRDRFDLPVAGITGTNGKTTTKDLLAALLGGAGSVHATRGNLNNDLGVPLTLLGLHGTHDFAVIEMGASSVGEIDALATLARPVVGIITNASRAHLAEFGSLEGIIRGKGELLDHLPSGGTAILNIDSPGFADWRGRAQCPVVTFGRTDSDCVWSYDQENQAVVLNGEPWPCPLPGEHNGANLAAAVLAGRALGVDDAAMRRGLAAFAGSAHRGVLLEIEGRVVLDDAYNANPGSMKAAVKTLVELGGEGRALAVLGHMAEMGPDAADIHREVGKALAASGVDTLLAVGPEAEHLRTGFDAAGGSGHYCATREEAALLLARLSAPGDRLLIKGSRSAAMEDLLPLLESSFQ
jgi:UDP-N-acetylmuramoyl-tripeptide--D-alanyl-D-alanine ligase